MSSNKPRNFFRRLQWFLVCKYFSLSIFVARHALTSFTSRATDHELKEFVAFSVTALEKAGVLRMYSPPSPTLTGANLESVMRQAREFNGGWDN